MYGASDLAMEAFTFIRFCILGLGTLGLFILSLFQCFGVTIGIVRGVVSAVSLEVLMLDGSQARHLWIVRVMVDGVKNARYILKAEHLENQVLNFIQVN
jgi:hypothetical protein